MTVQQLIQALALVENQQGEVMVRHGWQPAAAHYSMGLEAFGQCEPTLVISWRVNSPDDSELDRPLELPEAFFH